ncbi:MAG: hypothetical protein M1831_003459 [Alyxoria varia]|nr:MAG: hypothetical protein M1831_003459 [Alyxoria varia]
MSTFNGFVQEFPQIRIDYFRTLPGRPPPLACLLSHIHSDHLLGLDSLKSPFVYCSPATRHLLLRLEKYPHRMNFAKGILECRKQTYRHLAKLLKPIPLETPTRIELSPRNDVQVTLFDANHCLGAVMFLLENGKGDAVLYTGDVRAETWWVNSIARNPTLLRYTAASNFSRLSNIYLDTTFAVKSRPYREFPSRAEGMAELLRKVAMYPPDTLFYFHAWTFGYEDVWATLAQVLNSPIHLDPYRYSLYTSIQGSFPGSGLECRDSALMCGFKLGNVEQPGLFTNDHNVRLHSCERGTGCCPVIERRGQEGQQPQKIVWIKPIVSRDNGVDIEELGAGGGKGDLNQVHELDLADVTDVMQLQALCDAKITDEETRKKVSEVLERANSNLKHRLSFSANGQDKGLSLDDLEEDEDGNIPLKHVVDILQKYAVTSSSESFSKEDKKITRDSKAPQTATLSLPKTIKFPYSRHSSYAELRNLVEVFRPKDVYPCTAPTQEEFKESKSMYALFGDLVADTSTDMAWDTDMRNKVAAIKKRKREAGEFDTQQKVDEEEELVEAAMMCESNDDVDSVSGAESKVGTDMEDDAPRDEDKLPETSLKNDNELPETTKHLDDGGQEPARKNLPNLPSSYQSFITAESWDPHSSPVTQIPSSPPVPTSPSTAATVTPRKRISRDDAGVARDIEVPATEAVPVRKESVGKGPSDGDTTRNPPTTKADQPKPPKRVKSNPEPTISRPDPEPIPNPIRVNSTPNPTSTSEEEHTAPTLTRTKSAQERLARREAAARAVRSGTWGEVIRLECLGEEISEGSKSVRVVGEKASGARFREQSERKVGKQAPAKEGVDRRKGELERREKDGSGKVGTKVEGGRLREVKRVVEGFEKKKDGRRVEMNGQRIAQRMGEMDHKSELKSAGERKMKEKDDNLKRQRHVEQKVKVGGARPEKGKDIKEVRRDGVGKVEKRRPEDAVSRSRNHSSKAEEMEKAIIVIDDNDVDDDSVGEKPGVEDDGWGPTSSWEMMEREEGESQEL